MSIFPLPPQQTIDARPAALVNQKMVHWSELIDALGEAAGGLVLEEAVDDRLLAAAAERAGIVVGDELVEAERRFFYEALAEDPDQAVRLAQQVRERQGLGRTRFERLLRRNATLRALVAPEVTVGEESLKRMHESVHGPRRQGRLIIVPGLPQADAASRRIDAGESFGDVAVEVSSDPSAARGGLLEPISRVDPRYPEALRTALWSLEIRGVSPPVLLESSYAILQLVRELPADGVTLEEARPRLEELVRREQERILMDRLIRRLRSQASIDVIDRSLRESWEWRQRPRTP